MNKIDLVNYIQDHLLEGSKIRNEVASVCQQSVVSAIRLIVETFENGNKLLLCGNGGSAADCQHMAAEFVSSLSQDFKRPSLPAIALTTDSSILTAYTNDYGYEGVFARQIEGLSQKGDVLFAISTSGNSKNILRACQEAHIIGVKIISLTGKGGKLSEKSDVSIEIPSNDTQHIQECHLAIEHIICGMVEKLMFF
jgi:D-sedoheptulose 7-phosphate isomerase